MKTALPILTLLVMAAGTAAAQSTVTTTGGTSGTVPAFSGTSTLVNSPITVSGGAVGIGTATPGTAFQVISHASGQTGISIDNEAAYGSLDSTGIVRRTFVTTPTNDIHLGHVDAGWGSSLYFHSSGLVQILVNGNSGSWTNAETLLANGNVGIGTTTPGAKLEVAGNVKLTPGTGANITFTDGSVQTVAWNGVLQGGDYAESVDVSGDRSGYEPGDVLVIDPASKGKFLKSSQPYSTAVMGVYSTRPGVVGRRQKTDSSHMKDEVPLAMVGVVPTKVTAEGGPIKAGDLLVTSSRPGYAMKGIDHSQMLGAIIGKALEPINSGTGVIEVAVSIQ